MHIPLRASLQVDHQSLQAGEMPEDVADGHSHVTEAFHVTIRTAVDELPAVLEGGKGWCHTEQLQAITLSQLQGEGKRPDLKHMHK